MDGLEGTGRQAEVAAERGAGPTEVKVMYDTNNPFLRGNYAPWREEGDAFDLEVEGEVPRELNGVLYRIGPNPAFAPLGRYHWFDGDGMVHAIKLENGRASYRNRYVRTPGLLAEMKAG